MTRAIRSAGCTQEQLHSVLLVGGSSRMPIVAQLVSSEFGRPVAVEAHPKHAVALGGVAGQRRPAGAGEHRHGRRSRHGSEPARASARPVPREGRRERARFNYLCALGMTIGPIVALVTLWDDRNSASFVLTAIGLALVVVGVYGVSNV